MVEGFAARYNALPPDVRAHTAIFCGNYGEASAVNILGRKVWPAHRHQRPSKLLFLGMERLHRRICPHPGQRCSGLHRQLRGSHRSGPIRCALGHGLRTSSLLLAAPPQAHLRSRLARSQVLVLMRQARSSTWLWPSVVLFSPASNRSNTDLSKHCPNPFAPSL